MAIFTGGGDRGKTSLFSGERVAKHHCRVEAYGEVDELNSWLGAVTAVIDPKLPDLVREIQDIQSSLLNIGAWLSVTPGSSVENHLKPFSDDKIRNLEIMIQNIETKLPDLNNFLLPGGHMSSAFLHISRCVCRRVERRVVSLVEKADSIGSENFKHIIVFLNRLSDYLFVLARFCNQQYGTTEILWKG
jgi:cob(I)alamin adenosyltransferase